MTNENRPTLSNGKICYIEIPTIDVNVSVRFYQEVLAGRPGSVATAVSPLTIRWAK